MPTMIRALQPKYDLIPSLTLEAAKVSLRKEAIDVVVCCVYFDESRMFDLLRFMRADPAVTSVPILCVKAVPDMLGPAFLQAADIASRSLGAQEFVDFSEWLLELGEMEAFGRLHGVIERLVR